MHDIDRTQMEFDSEFDEFESDQSEFTEEIETYGDTEDMDGVKRQGERTYYVYDAAGQRVRKITELANNLKDERIYLGGFEIYRQRSGTNAGLVRESLHIMDDKQCIALVETSNDVDDGTLKHLIRYQLGNHLGSARLELDDTGQVISYEEYTPYGSTSYQAVRSQTETPKRYRYTGKELDEESGLYYHGARYYAPWLGRWMTCDPAGMVDGPNPYAMCAGDPISLLDPTGFQPDPSQSPGTYRDVANEKLGPLIRFFKLDKAEEKMNKGLSDDENATVSLYSGRAQFARGVEAAGETGVATGEALMLAAPAPEAKADALSTRMLEWASDKFGRLVKTVSSTLQDAKAVVTGLLDRSPRTGQAVEKAAEGGESFYRMMSFSEAKQTLTDRALQPSTKDAQSWVSTDPFYSHAFPPKVGQGDYDVILKLEVEPGTQSWLRDVGMSKMERGTENFGVQRTALSDFNAKVNKVDVYSLQGSQTKYLSPSGEKVLVKHKGYSGAVKDRAKYKDVVTKVRVDPKGRTIEKRGLVVSPRR